MKPKLLLVTNLFPTPNDSNRGIFTKQLAEKLIDYFDITIVCPLPWFPRLRFLSFFDRWYQFSLVPYEYKIGDLHVFSPKYIILPKLSEAFHARIIYRRLSRFITKLHDKYHFDVINSQWLYPDGVAVDLISRDLNIPIILTALGCDVNLFLEQDHKRQQIINALNHADYIVSVSKDLNRNILKHINKIEGKLSVIPNGVNKELFFPRDRLECVKILSLPPDKKMILFVGRIDEEKGINYLIESVNILSQKRDDFLLYLVGDGPLKPDIQDLVNKLNLNDKVHFTGNISHNEIAKWMGACSIFCLPSLREGCPNVILEALSSGRPVVASNVGGIPDMVDSQTGILSEPGNPLDLSKCIDKSLDIKWDYESISESVSNLTWDTAARKYFQLFTSLT